MLDLTFNRLSYANPIYIQYATYSQKKKKKKNLIYSVEDKAKSDLTYCFKIYEFVCFVLFCLFVCFFPVGSNQKRCSF